MRRRRRWHHNALASGVGGVTSRRGTRGRAHRAAVEVFVAPAVEVFVAAAVAWLDLARKATHGFRKGADVVGLCGVIIGSNLLKGADVWGVMWRDYWLREKNKDPPVLTCP